MLKLNDFKAHEVNTHDLLEKIKGGIACSQVIDVIEYLLDVNEEQAKVVTAMYVNGHLQCD